MVFNGKWRGWGDRIYSYIERGGERENRGGGKRGYRERERDTEIEREVRGGGGIYSSFC